MNEHASATCQQYDYDKEWIDLILHAKQIGLSTSEVRDFLIISKIKDANP